MYATIHVSFVDVNEKVTQLVTECLTNNLGEMPATAVIPRQADFMFPPPPQEVTTAHLVIANYPSFFKILRSPKPASPPVMAIVLDPPASSPAIQGNWHSHVLMSSTDLLTSSLITLAVQQLIALWLSHVGQQLPAFPICQGDLPPKPALFDRFCKHVSTILPRSKIAVFVSSPQGDSLIPRAISDTEPTRPIPLSPLQLEFSDHVTTTALAANSTVVNSAFPGPTEPGLYIAATFLKDGLKICILFTFPSGADAVPLYSVLPRLCQLAGQTLFNALDFAGMHARAFSAVALAQSLANFPDRHAVLLDACQYLQRLFQVDGVSILIPLEVTVNSFLRFEKVFVHHARRHIQQFAADRGYAYHVVHAKTALIIPTTHDSAVPPYGEAAEYSIHRNPATAHEELGFRRFFHLPYWLAPDTIENERSLMLCPVMSLTGTNEVVAVLKIGNLNEGGLFDLHDLKSLLAISNLMSPIIATADLGHQKQANQGSSSLMTKFAAHADALFYYREIALGLFHQVGNVANNVDWELRLARSLVSSRSAATDDIIASLDKCNEMIANGKRLIKTAQDRGQSLRPVPRNCYLMKDILRPAVDRTNKLLTQVPWEVDHTFGSDEYSLFLDPSLMKESIVNVLDNALWAVKKNRKNAQKRILVAVRPLPETAAVKIEITDNGVGIAPEDHVRVFSPFFTTKGEEGTGLGLYFAKRLIEEFGGSIGIQRSQIDRGTTIQIVLPVSSKE
jgi:signal transduction histidine kinase